MYENAINILKNLNILGYDAYIVGGYPRDMLLNRATNDIDICTSAPPDVIRKIYEVVQDNHQFGSLKIKYNSQLFEITTFRVDLEYQNRYPKIKFTNSLLEDLKRRDFIINTLCIDKDGEFVDLLGAKEDIQNKIIRCVGDIDQKLKQDPLRILRAIRFSTELEFKIEPILFSKMQEYKDYIKILSDNQIKKEMSKMNSKGIELLQKLEMEDLDAR